MTTTYSQPGDVLDFVAPSGGVTAGTPAVIGDMLVVPVATAAAGATFAGSVAGVHTLPMTASTAVDQGELLYWDASAVALTTTNTSNRLAGVSMEDGVTNQTSIRCRLNGVSLPAAGASS